MIPFPIWSISGTSICTLCSIVMFPFVVSFGVTIPPKESWRVKSPAPFPLFCPSFQSTSKSADSSSDKRLVSLGVPLWLRSLVSLSVIIPLEPYDPLGKCSGTLSMLESSDRSTSLWWINRQRIYTTEVLFCPEVFNTNRGFFHAPNFRTKTPTRDSVRWCSLIFRTSGCPLHSVSRSDKSSLKKITSSPPSQWTLKLTTNFPNVGWIFPKQ